ncbi:glycosyltransferase family 4 protein [Nonomuraea turcica]|uniref:glycosyltransferase family 4 protein n=1 Tax=Nonomuraea sp. G32 TaxID=3067274 RepID=UPI00273ADD04|nr:glycosyltransferase family 4 protein [Nonomuraea sp. G32]MDP4507647.1 glycosyltransferase family 4 protein [Nonomuraea sp. G32]
MRVAFVLGTTSGGTGRHVLMLTEGLVRRGHRVLVVGPRSVEEQFSFAAAGARFVDVAVSDRPHPGNDLRAVLAIRRLTREAEVVHAHGLRAGALAALGAGGRRGRLAALGAGGRRGRLVVTLHNALTAGGLVGFVYGMLERIVARRVDRVLVVSPDLGERMTRLGARDVRAAVVPAPALRPARRTPEEVRGELGAGQRPIMLTIARLAQQKGLETLLDVAAGPWGEGTGLPADLAGGPLFLVAGEGPLRAELEGRIRREALPVRLLGNRDDIPDLLGAATAVLTAARWEGQPLSIREALMAGKPVIATAVGGIPEIVGDAGILVPYGDVQGLRGAVRTLLEEPGAAETLATAAARRGREMPGGDAAVASVLEAYGPQDSTG